MINEVYELLGDDDGLYNLVEEYRGGRSKLELMELLLSDDTHILEVATWILAEIKLDKNLDEVLVGKLLELTSHSSGIVRFQSLNAVYECIKWNDLEAKVIIDRLCLDENMGVRHIASLVKESNTNPPASQ